MSSLGKIYTYPSKQLKNRALPFDTTRRLFETFASRLIDNWRVARARAVAVLGGADIEEIWVTMDVVKSAEMLEKFPAGVVPCFEAKDGTRIHQSAAIATYGKCRCGLRFVFLSPSPIPSRPDGRVVSHHSPASAYVVL